MKQSLIAPGPHPVRATAQAGASAGSAPGGPILVRRFVDRRSITTNPGYLNGDALLDADAPGHRAPDTDLITRLFFKALQRAGYEAMVAMVESYSVGRTPRAEAMPPVIEGEIWDFRFETRATSMLEVDLSLRLHPARGTEPLWDCEFPGDTTLPLWIGLGCDPCHMVEEALLEVEEAALLKFAAPDFSRAVRSGCGSIPLATPGRSDEAHEVVPGSSWTATDEGKIQATAIEAVQLKFFADIPTADLYEPAHLVASKKVLSPARAG